MATKSKEDFITKVEEELAKRGRGSVLAADIAKDRVQDAAVEEAPKVVATLSGKLEQGRRFLQQGTVPGAFRRLAQAKADTAAASGLVGRFTKAAPVQTAIELSKGAYLIGKEGARKGHAKAGERLAKEPLAYQAAKLMVSPAEALSKYGAAREARGKKAFEEEYINPLARKIAAEEERKILAEQSTPRKFFK